MGVDEKLYETFEEPIDPSSTVVLYTDGLVERRGESLDVGLERLAEAAGGGPEEPAALRDHILAAAARAAASLRRRHRSGGAAGGMSQELVDWLVAATRPRGAGTSTRSASSSTRTSSGTAEIPASGCQNRKQALEWMRRRAPDAGPIGELVELIDAGDKVVVIMRRTGEDGQPELIANLTIVPRRQGGRDGALPRSRTTRAPRPASEAPSRSRQRA